jgi:hypothetical protein
MKYMWVIVIDVESIHIPFVEVYALEMNAREREDYWSKAGFEPWLICCPVADWKT